MNEFKQRDLYIVKELLKVLNGAITDGGVSDFRFESGCKFEKYRFNTDFSGYKLVVKQYAAGSQ